MAKWDWDAKVADEGDQRYPGDDFDFTKVEWPLWMTVKTFYSETKENSKKTGTNVSIGFRLVDPGPWKGYGFFQNFVFENPSAKAQALGRKDLQAIMQSAGLSAHNDTNDLAHRGPDGKGCEFDALVSVEPGNERFPEDRLRTTDWEHEGRGVSQSLLENARVRYASKEPAKEPEPPRGGRYAVDDGGKPDPTVIDEHEQVTEDDGGDAPF